eukprot:gene3500-3769_t
MRKRVSHSGHCSAETQDTSDAVVVKDTTPGSGLLDVLYTTLGGWLVEGQEALPIIDQQDPVATQPRVGNIHEQLVCEGCHVQHVPAGASGPEPLGQQGHYPNA